MTTTFNRIISYEDRQAILTLRKSMRSKPWLIEELMKDQSHEMASRVLLQAKADLEQLLEVNRAFVSAASRLATKDKE